MKYTIYEAMKTPKPPFSVFFIQQKIPKAFHILEQGTRVSRSFLNHTPNSNSYFSGVLLAKIHPKEKQNIPKYVHITLKYCSTSKNKNPYFTVLKKIDTQMRKRLFQNTCSKSVPGSLEQDSSSIFSQSTYKSHFETGFSTS